MTRNTERIVSVVLAIVFVALFFIMGREGANTTIDNAQATASALQNTVDELLARPDVPDLSGELALAQAELDASNTQVAELLAATPVVVIATAEATLEPTAIPPTATPEQACFPANLDEVVAIRDPRVNLFEVIGKNKAGKWIMGIYEDDDGNRIQYSVGTTFYIYEEAITTDGGDVFYEVFGPRGKGLYVRAVHIKLFDANPDLYTCTS